MVINGERSQPKYLFTDDMILYIWGTRDPTKNPDTFRKVLIQN